MIIEDKLNFFDGYQQAVAQFATPLEDREAKLHGLFGLLGEAGEVAEKFKKEIRDGTKVSDDDLDKELGDVLWYIAYLCTIRGRSLNRVARDNFEKLLSRQQRGVLGGSGDNR